MSEHLLASLSIFKVCRLCLYGGRTMVSILHYEEKEEMDTKLQDRITSCLKIQVSEGDGLPDMICEQCIRVVNRFYRYQQQCWNSDAKLRHILKIPAASPREEKSPSRKTSENPQPETQENFLIQKSNTTSRITASNKNLQDQTDLCIPSNENSPPNYISKSTQTISSRAPHVSTSITKSHTMTNVPLRKRHSHSNKISSKSTKEKSSSHDVTSNNTQEDFPSDFEGSVPTTNSDILSCNYPDNGHHSSSAESRKLSKEESSFVQEMPEKHTNSNSNPHVDSSVNIPEHIDTSINVSETVITSTQNKTAKTTCESIEIIPDDSDCYSPPKSYLPSVGERSRRTIFKIMNSNKHSNSGGVALTNKTDSHATSRESETILVTPDSAGNIPYKYHRSPAKSHVSSREQSACPNTSGCSNAIVQLDSLGLASSNKEHSLPVNEQNKSTMANVEDRNPEKLKWRSEKKDFHLPFKKKKRFQFDTTLQETLSTSNSNVFTVPETISSSSELPIGSEHTSSKCDLDLSNKSNRMSANLTEELQKDEITRKSDSTEVQVACSVEKECSNQNSNLSVALHTENPFLLSQQKETVSLSERNVDMELSHSQVTHHDRLQQPCCTSENATHKPDYSVNKNITVDECTIEVVTKNSDSGNTFMENEQRTKVEDVVTISNMFEKDRETPSLDSENTNKQQQEKHKTEVPDLVLRNVSDKATDTCSFNVGNVNTNKTKAENFEIKTKSDKATDTQSLKTESTYRHNRPGNLDVVLKTEPIELIDIEDDEEDKCFIDAKRPVPIIKSETVETIVISDESSDDDNPFISQAREDGDQKASNIDSSHKGSSVNNHDIEISSDNVCSEHETSSSHAKRNSVICSTLLPRGDAELNNHDISDTVKLGTAEDCDNDKMTIQSKHVAVESNIQNTEKEENRNKISTEQDRAVITESRRELRTAPELGVDSSTKIIRTIAERVKLRSHSDSDRTSQNSTDRNSQNSSQRKLNKFETNVKNGKERKGKRTKESSTKHNSNGNGSIGISNCVVLLSDIKEEIDAKIKVSLHIKNEIEPKIKVEAEPVSIAHMNEPLPRHKCNINGANNAAIEIEKDRNKKESRVLDLESTEKQKIYPGNNPSVLKEKQSKQREVFNSGEKLVFNKATVQKRNIEGTDVGKSDVNVDCLNTITSEVSSDSGESNTYPDKVPKNYGGIPTRGKSLSLSVVHRELSDTNPSDLVEMSSLANDTVTLDSSKQAEKINETGHTKSVQISIRQSPVMPNLSSSCRDNNNSSSRMENVSEKDKALRSEKNASSDTSLTKNCMDILFHNTDKNVVTHDRIDGKNNVKDQSADNSGPSTSPKEERHNALLPKIVDNCEIPRNNMMKLDKKLDSNSSAVNNTYIRNRGTNENTTDSCDSDCRSSSSLPMVRFPREVDEVISELNQSRVSDQHFPPSLSIPRIEFSMRDSSIVISSTLEGMRPLWQTENKIVEDDGMAVFYDGEVVDLDSDSDAGDPEWTYDTSKEERSRKNSFSSTDTLIDTKEFQKICNIEDEDTMNFNCLSDDDDKDQINQQTSFNLDVSEVKISNNSSKCSPADGQNSNDKTIRTSYRKEDTGTNTNICEISEDESRALMNVEANANCVGNVKQNSNVENSEPHKNSIKLSGRQDNPTDDNVGEGQGSTEHTKAPETQVDEEDEDDTSWEFEETSDSNAGESSSEHPSSLNDDTVNENEDDLNTTLQKRRTEGHIIEEGQNKRQKTYGDTAEKYNSRYYRDRENNVRYTCALCNRSYAASWDLKKHEFTHTGIRPHECNLCGKRFALKEGLRRHEKVHEEITNFFPCDECGKTFSQKKYLMKHRSVHGDRTLAFECSVCNRRFAAKHHLKIHTRVHTGDRPYQCNICDRRFTGQSQLVTHKRSHSGEKPYKCNECDKAFIQRSHLISHLKSHKKSVGGKRNVEADQIVESNL